MYLGVHFPSDVVTGAVLGAGVTTAVVIVMWKPRRPRQP
jgi:membrane-associated phospholipid phosphatase